MTIQFNRSVRLTVTRLDKGSFTIDPSVKGVIITDLRVAFTVTRSLKSDPNPCEIKIYNLWGDTRDQLKKKPLRVLLEGGYDGVLRPVFQGDLRYGSSTFESPDWVTTLEVADGDRAFRYGRAQKSYSRGTAIITIIKDAAKAMGMVVPAAVAESPDLQRQFAAGETLSGNVRDELDRLLAPSGHRWSIQDGRLVVLKDSVVSGGAGWDISQVTGMIGSPTYGTPEKGGKPPTLTVKMLLRPEILAGDPVTLESDAVRGKFKVEQVKHQGDTHGGDWTTELELRDHISQVSSLVDTSFQPTGNVDGGGSSDES